VSGAEKQSRHHFLFLSFFCGSNFAFALDFNFQQRVSKQGRA
jgi:hypothetical protein